MDLFFFTISDDSDDNYFGICTVFPIIGVITVTVGCGYLYFGITYPKVVHGKERKDYSVEKPPKTDEEKDKV